MPKELDRYVNRIHTVTEMKKSRKKGEVSATTYLFTGDGEGDYEISTPDAPVGLLEAYLKDCLEQAELCQKLIQAKRDAAPAKDPAQPVS